MDKDKFFKQLSIESLVDEKLARKVYYSMLRLVVSDLKGCRRAVMPDLGIFTIKERKPRKIGMVGTGAPVTIYPKVLTFDANRKLKAYVKLICEDK